MLGVHCDVDIFKLTASASPFIEKSVVHTIINGRGYWWTLSNKRSLPVMDFTWVLEVWSQQQNKRTPLREPRQSWFVQRLVYSTQLPYNFTVNTVRAELTRLPYNLTVNAERTELTQLPYNLTVNAEQTEHTQLPDKQSELH